ncbi:Peptide/nickel transporter substrate-binding protein [Wenzhouxiangella marina]|uniref:Peptide/nickel transporter substrate-binding protein n=1 Tax=Wenzhouxiangella marina TaxID=1579979 RepID=A0A0K0XZI3_9GAMM|nr:Peptide/nickel transporter substrate-binding protein [Wenzhouxiangella marina]
MLALRTGLICVVLLVTGCGQAPEDRAVFRYALQGAPGSLDPVQADNAYAASLVNNLYDTLYRYRYLARPHELVPSLALTMPQLSEDGLELTIPIRPGVHFIDDPAFPDGRGREVLASDVVYSLARHFDTASRSRGAWLWRDRIVGLDSASVVDGALPDGAGLEAVDDYTVRVRLRQPFPQFAHTLATALSAIVPREAVDHYGPGFGIHPVGSGPYRLRQFDANRAVLERNAGFDRGPFDLAAEGFRIEGQAGLGLEQLEGRAYPFMDRLEIEFINEPMARWNSLRSSRGVDAAIIRPDLASVVPEAAGSTVLPPSLAPTFRAWASLESGFAYYGFNMSNPALGDHPDPLREEANRALRCALRDAFDWDARNAAFYRGAGQAFPGVIPPVLDAWDPALSSASIEYAPDRARQRLREAGWTAENLPALTIGIEAGVEQRQMFEQLRAWWVEIGYPADRLQARVLPSFGEYLRAIADGELDVFLLSWTLAYPDAQYALQLFYGPNAAPGANSFNYRNEDYDRWFEQAARLHAGPERTALYRAMNEQVIDDCVFIGSMSRIRLQLWRRDLVMLPDEGPALGLSWRFIDRSSDAP